MRVVANGVWGHAYGGACDDRCVERVPVVVVCVRVVCVSSGGVATMCGVRGGSIGGLELFGSSADGWREIMHLIYKLVAWGLVQGPRV